MYDSEYELDNYDEINENKLIRLIKSFNFDKKKIIIIGIILLIIIGLLMYEKTIIYQDSYQYLEEQLENSARNYVSSNNIESNQEFFLEASKLGVSLKDNCSFVSGVFVKENDYEAYLLCDEYESNIIDNSNNYITLNGKNVAFLHKGMEYVESSYITKKNISVKVNGNVGTEIGVYELDYIVLEYGVVVDTLTRKVVVLDNSEINHFYPSIELLGDNIEYLQERDTYIDKGAVAVDQTDGPISDIKVIGDVDTYNDGVYDLTYVAVNSKGYAKSVTRRVIVAKANQTLVVGSVQTPLNLTRENVKITISVFGSNYAHTVLPNGNMTMAKSFEYEVSENGDYEFMVYDANGNMVTKKINVSNINRSNPVGTCKVEVYSNYANISVNATSSIGISGYDYIINGRSSGYTTSFNYLVNNSNVKNVSVNVKDIIGNVGNINCQVEYMDPSIGNDNIKYYVAFGKEYVIPKTRNNLDEFVSRVKGKISQSADPTNCGSACLSFSLYHAYYLQYGDMNKMNLYDACNYKYPIRFDIIYNTNKESILKIIYDELLQGRVIVMQVDNNNQGRHFVLVVGYRRGVYSSSDLKEEDLIYIDSWGGTFNSIERGSRKMFDDVSRGGYRVDKIKSQYYSLWP